MRCLLAILFLLLPCRVWATAYVASVTGNWASTATWGGSGPPGNGDSVTINNGITVTIPVSTSVTVGTSPATGGTAAIACTSWTTTGTGTLVIYGSLTYRGPVEACGTGWVVEAGATIIHDSSVALSNAGAVVTPTGTWSSGSESVTLSSGTSVAVGQVVTGTGIAKGTQVFAISGTALTLSIPATASGSGATLSFYANVSYPWTYYFNCTTCIFQIEGTSGSPVTWGIAAGSGPAGEIGAYEGESYIKTFTTTYINASNIGSTISSWSFQDNLSNSGYTFEFNNSTCVYCAEMFIGAMAAGTTFEVNNSLITSVAGSTGESYKSLALGQTTGIPTDTSPVRQIENSVFLNGQLYVNCSALGTLPHITITGDVFTVSGAAATSVPPLGFSSTAACQFQSGEWANNLIWNNPSSGAGQSSYMPVGYRGATYFLTSNTGGTCPGTENTDYHPFEVSAYSSVANIQDTMIAEPLCTGTGGSEAGKLVTAYASGSAAWTEEWRNVILLPASEGTGYALSLFAIATAGCDGSTTFCPQTNLHNNTIYATNASGSQCGLGGLENTSQGVAAQYSGLNNNIFYLTSAGSGCYMGNTALIANAFQGAGNNWNWNVTGGVEYPGTSADYQNPSTPGTSDTNNTNPNFVDDTRNFQKFCSLHDSGATTWALCIADFAAFDSWATPANLIAYVRGGFQPENAATATAGGQPSGCSVCSTSTQVGAVPYVSTMPPVHSSGIF